MSNAESGSFAESKFLSLLLAMSILGQIVNALRPRRQIVRSSTCAYELRCEECGKTAATFRLGPGQTRDEALNYDGITGYSRFKAEDAPTIFAMLNSGELDLLHVFLDKYTHLGVRGIDAYCPQCSKIYCPVHYRPYENRDGDGFLDSTTGTCPKGHSRIIAD